MNKILIIEDDKNKIDRLKAFFSQDELIIKESFQSGLVEIKNNIKDYSFLILDMTIPLWEKGNNDLGGNYEQFGGEKVLKEMKRRKLSLPTILFTMFDIFPTKDGSITFNEINSIFKNEFPEFYVGAVFFNANSDNWQLDISLLISKIKV